MVVVVVVAVVVSVVAVVVVVVVVIEVVVVLVVVVVVVVGVGVGVVVVVVVVVVERTTFQSDTPAGRRNVDGWMGNGWNLGNNNGHIAEEGPSNGIIMESEIDPLELVLIMELNSNIL